MIARKLLALGLALILFGGCGTKITFYGLNYQFPEANTNITEVLQSKYFDLKTGLYYVEASGGFGVPSQGVIFYKVDKSDRKDSPNTPLIIVLSQGVERSIWARILEIAVGGSFIVAGNAVYGLSLEAAKTMVSQAVTASPSQNNTQTGASSTATGGAGGSSTSTGGSSSATTGAITNTNSATGGSSTNTNTNSATGGAGGSSTSKSCSAGENMGNNNCN